MTAARRKTRRRAFNVKRPKPRRGKVRFITRAGALARAKRHVLDRLFKSATVRDGAETKFNAYGIRQNDTWVVYKNCAGTGLRASDVVVICKRTGRVLYEGSAGDEG